jgi:hypothetical protein
MSIITSLPLFWMSVELGVFFLGGDTEQGDVIGEEKLTFGGA